MNIYLGYFLEEFCCSIVFKRKIRNVEHIYKSKAMLCALIVGKLLGKNVLLSTDTV